MAIPPTTRRQRIEALRSALDGDWINAPDGSRVLGPFVAVERSDMWHLERDGKPVMKAELWSHIDWWAKRELKSETLDKPKSKRWSSFMDRSANDD